MRLLSLKLDGQYKGLKNQYFDFHCTQGNIVALIGLNGSGKSQLLELIAEAFAFLERRQRKDFKVKTPLGFGFELTYQLGGTTDHSAGSLGMECGSPLAVAGGISQPRFKVTLNQTSKEPSAFVWLADTWNEIRIEELELPYIVGYSSGQNENLQRSFMKNAVQYFDNMRIRLNRRKELNTKLNDAQISDINKRYLKRAPHLFEPEDSYFESRYLTTDSGEQLRAEAGEPLEVESYLLDLREYPTALSKCVYLDYDCAGLALASLALLPTGDIDTILSEITFKYPKELVLHYDLRGDVAGRDEVRDIQLLARIAGEDNIEGLSQRTTDTQYEVFEMNYLSGLITLNLDDPDIKEQLNDASYGEPAAFFRRLYKLQQLGVKSWLGVTRQKLRRDNFDGTVKKPLKTKLPLSVERLVLADGSGRKVCLDDLSDGEAQLIEVLATARIFSPERTLFLFDEPETHLNPSWRTYFHSHLSKAMVLSDNDEAQAQVFLSTHSPFMVSSLKREDVLFFERDDDGLIQMEPVGSQTYGASFEVLIKKHFGLQSLISQTVIEEIREQLKQGDAQALEWINEHLGMSPEKAYLVRKLSQ
ncbi:AAA family ATPase [Vibrio alginolyticus]|uniref:AAA family ATPase n=1 Tax=Vibrio alginolyticus TaxID=663 RepID=UPI001BD3963E|nr:AAA family ATPase [Vibrio alginolyticus]MBS9838986.1 AAA family ATPase [Vibrio alginolyticus]